MSRHFPRIILSSGKEQSLLRFHTWIFSGAIKKINGKANDGDIVEVYDNKNKFLALGHYQDSSIAVRIFSFEPVHPDSGFWKSKIQNAFLFREKLGLTENPQTNSYRLVFAEGDGLPGLIIDYYNGTCVLQCHSIGMYLLKNEIAAVLKEIYGENLKGIYDKSKESLPKHFSATVKNEYLPGKGSEAQQHILENGSSFWVDWKEGQKTGFFLDQRENRQLLLRYCKDKTVLDAFCYTGSFSVFALRGGAKEVVSLDSSRRAIEIAEKNVKLNSFSGKHKIIVADVFDYFSGNEGNKYDIIILDPPAFAKHLQARHHAVLGYKRLNTEALRQIKPGGILFTFSCSQVTDRSLFEKTICSAAIVAKRKVRVLHHLSQSADHPVNIFHPEGEYLKGLVLFVE